jgi:hypothetical protein
MQRHSGVLRIPVNLNVLPCGNSLKNFVCEEVCTSIADLRYCYAPIGTGDVGSVLGKPNIDEPISTTRVIKL